STIKKNLENQVNDLEKQKESYNARIDKEMETVYKQYTNLEVALSKMSSQSAYLTNQLTNMNSSQK
ncbi:MAG: flagellar filament capping protein FliD, partial [bacterium]